MSAKNILLYPISLLFKDFKSKGDFKIVRLPAFKGIIKYIFRVFYDFFLLPTSSFILNASAVIVLANYSPMIVSGKKIVFMRHLFLAESCPAIYDDPKNYIIEQFRRLMFILTLMSTDVLVVQSSYVQQVLLKRYGRWAAHMVIYILSNPISNLIDLNESDIDKSVKYQDDKIVLYVSRYYPHKNHHFLMRLADTYQNEFRSEKINFILRIVSSEKFYLEGVNVQNVQWTLETELETLQSFDIGIMPLEDNDYNKGKCGFKALQYMAVGLPVVCSPVGMNKEIIEEGVNGFSAVTKGEWIKKLSELIENPELRKKMGGNGRKLVEKNILMTSHTHNLKKLSPMPLSEK